MIVMERGSTGDHHELAVETWRAPATAKDLEMLSGVRPAALDHVRLSGHSDDPGPWFEWAWAWVGADAIPVLSTNAGFTSCQLRRYGVRHVAHLTAGPCPT